MTETEAARQRQIVLQSLEVALARQGYLRDPRVAVPALRDIPPAVIDEVAAGARHMPREQVLAIIRPEQQGLLERYELALQQVLELERLQRKAEERRKRAEEERRMLEEEARRVADEARRREAERRAAAAAEAARMAEEESRRVAEEQRQRERLKTMGLCPAGFEWIREGEGYRCAGGSHYVRSSEIR